MSNGKTIGQLMEEARIQAGAQNYKGHDYTERRTGKPISVKWPLMAMWCSWICRS